MEKTPDMLRIRNDNFLKKVVEKENCSLLVFFKIKEKIHWIFYFGKSFYGYNKSISSSNSFINFSYDEFINNYCNEQGTIQIKNIRKNKTKYIFFTSCDENFDEGLFDNFYKTVSASNYDPYDDKSDLLKADKAMSQESIANVKNKYNNLCAVYFTSGNESCFAINWNHPLLYESIYFDIHHFIPRSYFKNYMELVDWNIIHDEINLIPLCPFCHKGIHSKNPIKTREKFYEIINAFKKIGLYNTFIDFLKKHTEFKNEEELLVNFYLK